MSTWEIDQSGGELIKISRLKVLVKAIVPAIVFSPSSLSVNEVVHGIGVKERILKEGDIISVDVC